MVLLVLPEPDEQRISRWYFGGIAATFAQIFVQPIDVIKVGLQTQQVMEKFTTFRYTKYILSSRGMTGLFTGTMTAMRHQMVYSITRFGIHQKVKEILEVKDLPFFWELGLTTVSGAVGGFFRNPLEIINIRMQTDLKLSPEKAYNYKNTRQALKFIHMVDGYRALFSGVTLTVLKAVTITVGQICLYDQTKHLLIKKYQFTDTPSTHVIASALAGFMATIISQPIEVLKVRYMSSTYEYQDGIWEVFKKQVNLGVLGFYRGTMLNFIKIEIQTIIIFVVLEQMRLRYGYIPQYCTGQETDKLHKQCIPNDVPPASPEEKEVEDMPKDIAREQIHSIVKQEKQDVVVEERREIESELLEEIPEDIPKGWLRRLYSFIVRKKQNKVEAVESGESVEPESIQRLEKPEKLSQYSKVEQYPTKPAIEKKLVEELKSKDAK